MSPAGSCKEAHHADGAPPRGVPVSLGCDLEVHDALGVERHHLRDTIAIGLHLEGRAEHALVRHRDVDTDPLARLETAGDERDPRAAPRSGSASAFCAGGSGVTPGCGAGYGAGAWALSRTSLPSRPSARYRSQRSTGGSRSRCALTTRRVTGYVLPLGRYFA